MCKLPCRLMVSTFLVLSVRICISQQPAGTKGFSYEVVSVRPYASSEMKGDLTVRPDSLFSNIPIANLVRYAFGVRRPDQVKGLPNWAESTRFVVQAKVDHVSMKALNKLPIEERLAQRRRMCIAMLSDRFAMKFHHDIRQLPVYDLVIAKHGPKLKNSDAKSSSSSMWRGELKGTGMTISDIVERLTGSADRQIIDKTGITGRFDLELDWAFSDDPDSTAAGPSIFTALQDQLGLKLVSSKAPIDIVVIDAFAKPSAN